MLLILTLILISENVVQAQDFKIKDLVDKFSYLEVQFNAVKEELMETKSFLNGEISQLKAKFNKCQVLQSDLNGKISQLEIQFDKCQVFQSNLTNQIADLKYNKYEFKSKQQENIIQSNEDNKEVPTRIKSMKSALKNMSSKMHFNKRNLKQVNSNGNHIQKKDKRPGLTLFDLQKEIDTLKEANIIQSNEDETEVPTQVKNIADIEDIRKHVTSQMHLIKRKFKRQHDRNNKKGKQLRVNTFDLKRKFDKFEKDLKGQVTTLMDQIKVVESKLSKLTRCMLPPNLSKLVGTRVQSFESRGPLSSVSLNGSWTWKTTEDWSQEYTDNRWSEVMHGVNFVRSGPIILPLTPHFIGAFGFEGYRENEMKIYFYCYDIKHNQDLLSNLPFKFEVQIRIQDQGFTEKQKCSFEVAKLDWRWSDDLIPINKNWNKNKFPKDIEFVFL